VHFPVYIGLGRWSVHPHLFFELLGYGVAFALFLGLRRRDGDPVDRSQRWFVVAAALIGGVAGSRILAWPNGKTIVGGLVGGIVAVEWAKKLRGVRTATGDLFAIPLAVGIAIGRIGCFLTGLSDDTYGNPTTLWTGVDFGDGVPRHPTQLYEVAFLALLVAVLIWARRKLTESGDQFRLFVIAYMAFRLGIDFLKPEPAFVLRLSLIQWACVGALAYYARDVPRVFGALRRGL
jgi:phosphatidylglycerol:prolipoprotein diacylglycerol transferase